MKLSIKIYFIVSLIIIVILSLSNASFCGNTATQEKTAMELTKSFKADGFNETTFKSIGQDTIAIRQANIIQNERLTEGQLVNAFGIYLKPDVVSKLKKAGFKKGIFTDGHNRNYPFEISTKYYKQMTNFFKKLSGSR